MYIYELLNMIGVNTPEEAIRKMREFEKGFLDSGVGDRSMRENLHRWIMEFAVLSGSPKEEVLPLIDPDLIDRDRQLMVLRKPQDHSDEEVFGALNALTGGKTEKSSAILKEPERGIHLFAELWRYMAEHYDDCGWDIFAACFGKLRKFPWHPLANAVFLDQKKREEAEYKVTECRKFVCKNGEWSEIRYDELFFDRYRVHGIVHEADRQIRRYLKTGHYLREKKGEEWITPYVEAVIEKDRAAAEEAAKPKIMIDLSGLEKIRRDAQITRDSLLTEDEKREQAPDQTLEQAIGQVMKHAPELTVNPVSQHEEQQIVGAELPEAAEDSREEEKPAVIEIPSLDETHGQILGVHNDVNEGGGAEHHQDPVIPGDIIDLLHALFHREVEIADQQHTAEERRIADQIQPGGEERDVDHEQRKEGHDRVHGPFLPALPYAGVGFAVIFFHDLVHGRLIERGVLLGYSFIDC